MGRPRIWLVASIKLVFLGLTAGCSDSSELLVIPSEKMYSVARYNQLGYYPNSEVRIAIPGNEVSSNVELADWASQRWAILPVVQKNKWSEKAGLPYSLVKVENKDAEGFLSKKAMFFINDPGKKRTELISIIPNLYKEVLPAAVKSYWFQRANYSIDTSYGGQWSRPAGHPDDEVKFHKSSGRVGEDPVSSSGGWYDAGDYNKYIVNGAFSVGIMLQLAEQFPNTLADGTIDFPDARNGRNDLLDELKYEIDWMLTMQDRRDGGVHHKLTTEKFEGMVMPHNAVNQRFILAKGTAASLDFSACLAQASRVFAKAGEVAYAKTLLDAAHKAYQWAVINPNVVFRNPAGVNTGEYGDPDFQDELLWAKTELLLTTGDTAYAGGIESLLSRFRLKAGNTWNSQMSNLAVYSLLQNETLDILDQGLISDLRDRVVLVADSLIRVADTTAFHQPINDWHWGSNSDVLGAAMVSATAHRLTGKDIYLQATRQWTDYIFGYNPTGYCYVTGFGKKSPMNIHHRPSQADGIEDPIPGFLVGGPNAKKQDQVDGAIYQADCAPMESYVDQVASYASNEVCLNWNAPLVYILGYLENNQSSDEE